MEKSINFMSITNFVSICCFHRRISDNVRRWLWGVYSAFQTLGHIRSTPFLVSEVRLGFRIEICSTSSWNRLVELCQNQIKTLPDWRSEQNTLEGSITKKSSPVFKSLRLLKKKTEVEDDLIEYNSSDHYLLGSFWCQHVFVIHPLPALHLVHHKYALQESLCHTDKTFVNNILLKKQFYSNSWKLIHKWIADENFKSKNFLVKIHIQLNIVQT